MATGKMTSEERTVYTKAFRASKGKKMQGKSGDAEAAVKKYRTGEADAHSAEGKKQYKRKK